VYASVDYSLSATLTFQLRNGNLIKSAGPIPSSVTTLKNFSRHCPASIRINILSQFEPIYGRNLGQAVFFSAQGIFLRRPQLARVVVGEGCSLMNKLVSPFLLEADSDLILQYALLRYFLWFIIEGKWCIDIVKGRYTELFTKKLLSSCYARWQAVYESEELRGYCKYFVY
jgi:hypothetical protein